LLLLVTPVGVAHAAFRASDPGVRGGDPGAGAPLHGLKAGQLALFHAGKQAFEQVEGVADGIGPRFNLDSCAGCHAQPATGGTSPLRNPQVDVTQRFPNNTIPSFITADGPVREARFKWKPDGALDGGVHDLFVIDCGISQEDYETQLARNNVIFRIPTPAFGAGLIEAIPDSAISGNQQANADIKQAFGVRGRANRQRVSGDFNANGNDGTLARFGWKAQNKSLLLFSGEAYNVEMGISNELFQTEREEAAACQFKTVPNDVTNTETLDFLTGLSDLQKFAFFMRFLAPPVPSTNMPGGAGSIARGKTLFGTIGCALCHTPSFQTGSSPIKALANQPVNLYSDLLVHNMGTGLADGVSQGQAGPDEFRSAPLWGLGQRIFLLHDGRTTDLLDAIQAHQSQGSFSMQPSEANFVVSSFNTLSEQEKQDVLNFLRSL
jgi:CxxC motif-containing protein (DUF1111 family)